jgi:hypothetical protein
MEDSPNERTLARPAHRRHDSQQARELADMAVGTGETWIGQLPEHELRRLFELGQRV